MKELGQRAVAPAVSSIRQKRLEAHAPVGTVVPVARTIQVVLGVRGICLWRARLRLLPVRAVGTVVLP